ncbi:hypothetical protein XF_2097 [Xylella fastidiosa 9a5c]|uniref:Uncharacterized protein n=2 Tax=Xylella fastidiosa TaxID=2371 RepID=Q9PBP3_XYLFA|nr:hypothetical protein [Xylella fastidiosa]AAF84896.1 hypothetical protein XF_2097 [Xylella fastidiosa 9a5c]
MMNPLIPNTYEAWRHCIEHRCNIPLTHTYIEERLAALRDPNNFHTQQFIRCWGETHLRQITHWFTLAIESEQHTSPHIPGQISEK